MSTDPNDLPELGGFPFDLPRRWRRTAPWRQAVQRRRTMLFDDLACLDDSCWQPCQRQERSFLIEVLLADANFASQEKVCPRKWWWGTEVERAWARLREVEERTVHLLSAEEVVARAAVASAHAGHYLHGADQRVVGLEVLRAEAARTYPPYLPTVMRSFVIEVLRASHAKADRVHQEARYLRNRLVLATIFSLLSALGLVLAQLMFAEVEFVEQPEGWRGAGWQFLVAVMIFGAVGSLFTAIPAMSRVPCDFSPFNLPLQQGLLKLAFAPIVALTGLVILSTEPLGVAPPRSVPSLIIAAVFFGAGQQAVTRYVDGRAEQILTAGAPNPTLSSP
jgi:hypothetical protein